MKSNLKIKVIEVNIGFIGFSFESINQHINEHNRCAHRSLVHLEQTYPMNLEYTQFMI